MTSQRTKRLRKLIPELTLRSAIRPSRNGYWVCPSCSTINQAPVTVMPGAYAAQAYYAVPDRVTCKRDWCGHTFDTLPPLPQTT